MQWAWQTVPHLVSSLAHLWAVIVQGGPQCPDLHCADVNCAEVRCAACPVSERVPPVIEQVIQAFTQQLETCGKSEVKPPGYSEELRYRLKLMGIAWEFLRLKFPNKDFLRDLSSDT